MLLTREVRPPAPAVPVNLEATEPGYKSGRDPFSDVEVWPNDWAETPVPGTVIDVPLDHDEFPAPAPAPAVRGERQALADPWDVAPPGWTQAPECDAPVIMPKRGREDVLWRWWARPALCLA
jgi:hypothetical protein